MLLKQHALELGVGKKKARIKVTGDSLLIHAFAYSLFISLCSVLFELNRVSQPISIEYRMVHGFNKAVLKTQNFKIFPFLDLSNFQAMF